MLTVRAATESDILSLAPRLREADLLELKAWGERDPVQALMEGLHSPDGCFVAVTPDDVPQIIFGTTPSSERYLGFVWMMGTDAIKTHWVQVLRETKMWLNRIRGDYLVLANAVYAKNTLHIKWIRWAGFVFLRKLSINGEEFYEFAKLFPMEG